MIKKIKHPDGTEEVVEGTPEEVAAYERALNEGRPATKRKPPILKGKELEELQQWIRESIDVILRRIDALPPPYQVTYYPQVIQWPPLQPSLPSPCIWCGNYGCNRNHIICTGITTAGTSIALGGQTSEITVDGGLIGSSLKLTS